MPCDGIAVMSAELAVDLQEHFADEVNRQTLLEHLQEAIDLERLDVRWFNDRWNDSYQLVVGRATTLAFKRGQVFLRGQQAFLNREDVIALYNEVQAYAGQVMQADVMLALEALELNATVSGFTPDGTLSLELDI